MDNKKMKQVTTKVEIDKSTMKVIDLIYGNLPCELTEVMDIETDRDDIVAEKFEDLQEQYQTAYNTMREVAEGIAELMGTKFPY